jgi:hypothetical protein
LAGTVTSIVTPASTQFFINAVSTGVYQSNFRITNTAVYTANFTVPTAPLTAIAGTQLLTLQSATLIDNGPYAISLTSSGTTMVASPQPFGSGTPGANFLFDGSGSWVSSGNLIPSANITYNLGNSTNRWGTIYGNIISVAGNVTTGVSSGVFGVPNVSLHAAAVVTSAGNSNQSAQFAFQNFSTGSNASADIAIYNNIGNDAAYFVDMGIVSNTYNGAAAGANLFSANDGYLYVAGNSITGPVGSGANIGNLILGATNGQVITFLGNLSTSNIITVVSTSGLSVTGNVSATANVLGGNVLTGGIVSATANITGGNIQTAGQISAESVFHSLVSENRHRVGFGENVFT